MKQNFFKHFLFLSLAIFCAGDQLLAVENGTRQMRGSRGTLGKSVDAIPVQSDVINVPLKQPQGALSPTSSSIVKKDDINSAIKKYGEPPVVINSDTSKKNEGVIININDKTLLVDSLKFLYFTYMKDTYNIKPDLSNLDCKGALNEYKFQVAMCQIDGNYESRAFYLYDNALEYPKIFGLNKEAIDVANTINAISNKEPENLRVGPVLALKTRSKLYGIFPVLNFVPTLEIDRLENLINEQNK